MAKITNVLSLFDGLSCGQIALKELGIIPAKYYASEIDKHAIAQTQLNFPNTIQLGSVLDVDVSKLEPIDMILAGSPCTNFSAAGKRNGMSTVENEEIYTLDRYLQLKEEGSQFEGQSYLFWEYMRILTDIRKYNPGVKFLLENVEMGDKWERVLSEAIGVFGVHINSALVSAQNRKRIYFTNIRVKQVGLFGELHSDIPQPEDEGILLKDILEKEVEEKYYLSEKMIGWLGKHSIKRGIKIRKLNGEQKAGCLTATAQVKQNLTTDYICVAQRGRNPDNPSDRTSGSPTEQRLEPNLNGITLINSINKHNEKRENKRRSCEILLALREEINSKKNVEREMAVYARFFKDEVLFKRMYEKFISESEVRAENDKEWEKPSSKNVSNCNVFNMQFENWDRCSSQRQKSIKQFIRQLAACMSELSQQNTSSKESMHYLWQTTKRVWVLRKALSEIQKIWEPICSETKPVQQSGRIRRLTPTEASRLQTIPGWYKWESIETICQNFNSNNICQQYANQKDVINQSQVKKLACATNTILGFLEPVKQNYQDMSLIRANNVAWKVAVENNKQASMSASCTINDLKSMGLLNCLNELTSQSLNVNFVLKRLEEMVVLECAISTTKCGKFTEILYIPKKTESNQAEMDIIEILMENNFIGKLQKKLSEENLSKELKLSIILTLINLIMSQVIWSYLRKPNTHLYISSSIELQENSLELKLSNIKMDRITKTSDSSIYKLLGNGWNIETVKHILKFMK